MKKEPCEDTVYIIPLKSLLKHVVNPFICPPWEGNYIFTKNFVQKCLDNKDLCNDAWDYGKRQVQKSGQYNKTYHARRVSYLIVNPSSHPINIDVGIPSLGYIPEHIISDGNHRFAASCFKNEKEIALTYSGSCDLFEEMFPNYRIKTANC